MDIEFAKKFNIPLLPLSTPRPVLMADRTSSSHGPILFQTVPVRLSLGLHVETIEFLITSLVFPVLLGLPWMRLHNPSVNWKTLIFTFEDPDCVTLGHCKTSVVVTSLDLLNSVNGFSSSPSGISAEKPPACSSIVIDSINTSDFLQLAREESLEIFGILLPPRD